MTLPLGKYEQNNVERLTQTLIHHDSVFHVISKQKPIYLSVTSLPNCYPNTEQGQHKSLELPVRGLRNTFWKPDLSRDVK